MHSGTMADLFPPGEPLEATTVKYGTSKGQKKIVEEKKVEKKM